MPLQFTTDDGEAIPAGNNLNVLGGSGVETYADPDQGDNLYIKIQNSFTDQTQTIGAVTNTITTIPLTLAGTYTFEVRVSAWETGGTAAKGFSVNGVARSDGVAATLISDADGFNHSDAALNTADVNLEDSGINILIRVTGVDGLTINWGAITVYVFRGA